MQVREVEDEMRELLAETSAARSAWERKLVRLQKAIATELLPGVSAGTSALADGTAPPFE